MKPKLSNGDIYRKVLTFSIRRLFFCILYVAVLVGLTAGGFIISDNVLNMKGGGLVGMGVGFVIALVLIGIISHFFMYIVHAGQIAVITKAVIEDELPENTWETGKAMVKERFLTVAVYYAATGVIKAIFRELGNLITKIGDSVGGDAGSTVGSVISIIINTVIDYLCNCCLGWVFFRKEMGAFKATCEGAVIFFKHGKTLLKNLGRVFGIGLASLIGIGGAFFGIIYVVALQFQKPITALADEIRELSANSEPNKLIDFLSNGTTLTIAIAALLAVILWSIIHGTFVKPFILVGVLRNYMTTGLEHLPEESEFDVLEKNSKKFKKYKKKYADEL